MVVSELVLSLNFPEYIYINVNNFLIHKQKMKNLFQLHNRYKIEIIFLQKRFSFKKS